MKKRIIAKLDIKGPNLVKGISLEGLRPLGRPLEFANRYFEDGIDEIILTDVVASLYERNNIGEIIIETAKNIYIPITVGGGIRSIEDIRKVLRLGADKVSINTAGFLNQSFLGEAVKVFGSSTIVANVELIKHQGEYYCFTDNGREFTNVKFRDWIQVLKAAQVGEILITMVDTEGKGEGINIKEIINFIRDCKIPIVFHGGIGVKKHVKDILKYKFVSGVAISSCLHYDFIIKNQTTLAENEGNREFLRNKRTPDFISPFSVGSLKSYLIQESINVRLS